MTPLLTKLENMLISTRLVTREQVTTYITEATPEYALPYDPDGKLAADAPIEMGITPPATLVIKPFAGDLLDLLLSLELILDDLAPQSRGNDKRCKVSAEPLDDHESVIVVSLSLRERVRYVPAADGNLDINGITYKREALQERPALLPLHSVRYVG
jgi:hypothetical protein